MSKDAREPAPPAAGGDPPSRQPVAHSGAGAGTALDAMLRTRQMRPRRDAHGDAAPADEAVPPAVAEDGVPQGAPQWHAQGMKRSAGLLMFRHEPGGELQVLLAHPGGPFWRGRDDGAWTIPKGEYAAPETALDAAQREFSEETGFAVTPPLLPLGEVTQKSGKRVSAWAFAGDCEPGDLRCNTFEMEWPPRSGQRQHYPEIDRVAWFGLDEARRKLMPAQCELLTRLQQLVAS